MTTIANLDTESSPGDQVANSRDQKRAVGDRACLGAALGVATAVWVALFVVRIHAHQANVDDFAYAQTARTLWRDPMFVLHTEKIAPLVPLIAAPGAALFGIYGAIAAELPLLLALVAGAYLLTRLWTKPLAALVTALAVGLNEAVVGYSMMLNFAIAAAATTMWCFVTWFRSDHLRNWPWSIGFGIAFGALLLSRSLSPAYGVPFAAVIGVELWRDLRRRPGRNWRPALVATGVGAAVGGPWWISSGGQAVHYLLDAGYQPSSGYTSRGFVLTPLSVVHRVSWSIVDLGDTQAWLLAVGIVASIALLIWRRDLLRQLTGIGPVAAWIIASLLILSSSSNMGTEFALPLLVALMVLVGACLGTFVACLKRANPRRLVSAFALFSTAAALLLGLGGQIWGLYNPWWPGPPYRLQIIVAGGTSSTSSDVTTEQVSRAIEDTPVLIAKDDDIFNLNGLNWFTDGRAHPIMPPSGPNETQATIALLSKVDLLVTGASVYPYHPGVNQNTVVQAAAREGFVPVRIWTPGPYNTVVLWQRAAHPSHQPSPDSIGVYQPTRGATLHGGAFITAVTGGPLAVSKVVTSITGPGISGQLNLPATRYVYGWLSGWDTRSVPDGTYFIRSTAYDSIGGSVTSSPVTVMVRNR